MGIRKSGSSTEGCFDLRVLSIGTVAESRFRMGNRGFPPRVNKGDIILKIGPDSHVNVSNTAHFSTDEEHIDMPVRVMEKGEKLEVEK